MPWTKMRHKLENEYLAESLRGRITYYVTTYRKFGDCEGRAAIRLDGEEILRGNYMKTLENYDKFRRSEFSYFSPGAEELSEGAFDQRFFYHAFETYDNSPISESLKSESLLVRIFAILDRRVGKRTLRAMKETIDGEPDILKLFYLVRCEAEGIRVGTDG